MAVFFCLFFLGPLAQFSPVRTETVLLFVGASSGGVAPDLTS